MSIFLYCRLSSNNEVNNENLKKVFVCSNVPRNIKVTFEGKSLSPAYCGAVRDTSAGLSSHLCCRLQTACRPPPSSGRRQHLHSAASVSAGRRLITAHTSPQPLWHGDSGSLFATNGYPVTLKLVIGSCQADIWYNMWLVTQTRVVTPHSSVITNLFSHVFVLTWPILQWVKPSSISQIY